MLKFLPAVVVLALLTAAGGVNNGEAKETNASIMNIKQASEIAGFFYNDTPTTKKESAKKKNLSVTTGSHTVPQRTSGAGGGGAPSGSSTYTPSVQVPASGYQDGVYEGSGTGFAGTIRVRVTVQGNKITQIDIIDASAETPSYLNMARAVISRVISSQSPNVDAVAGATYSSNGIIQAIQNALSQAGAAQTEVTPTVSPTVAPTATPTPTPVPEQPDEEEENIYQDGTYTASADGFSGKVTIKLVIKKGKIKSISAEHTDTPVFFEKAWSILKQAILDMQSTNGIDAVSGATYSSNGILNATADALAQARVPDSNVTPTPVPTEIPEVTPEVTPEPELPEVTPEITPEPEIPEVTPEITPEPDTPEVTPEITPEPELPEVTPEITPEITPEPTPSSPYRDGTFSGSAYGYEGIVNVTVTITGGRIVAMTQTNNDTPEFFDDAWNHISNGVYNNQSTAGIDGVTGATYSSWGILDAINMALNQARR